jgi:hypothetical protein
LPGRLQAFACDDRLTYRERRAIIAALGAEMDTGTPEGANSKLAIAGYLTRFDAGEIACAQPAP